MEPLRKQLLVQRKTITSLKSDIDKLQRGIKALAKGTRKSGQVESAPTTPTTRKRFSAGGLRKLREKFGLSREAFAPLLGASAQTVYNWEQQGTRPRPEIIEKIAILRGMSKRQVLAVLDQHSSPPTKSTKRTPTKNGQKPPKKTGKPAKKKAMSGKSSDAAATA
ncbi:helix-turn-helix family protein [Lysobacter gummosus]|nr:helix-turn-helix family protein [Lysobacter gummosus]